ncbi:T9SS type A sorting domain-containing protein [Chryseobacterium taklimakanense]|uniref:T9SS C-terminal target domain-containing protein n=1 Tax=Chryseobacterium taklimakanense TaxID=536441 RepID=A0A3G8WMX6_9FLAO|nr:T9SS C-terminal target domain-containing protein [Chryseobacterium taklimakanense]
MVHASDVINFSQPANGYRVYSLEGILLMQESRKSTYLTAPAKSGVYIVRFLTSDNNTPVRAKFIVH